MSQQSRHIDDFEQFTLAERNQRRTPQSQLNCSPDHRPAVARVVGIPLETYLCGDRGLPCFAGDLVGVVPTGSNGARTWLELSQQRWRIF